jgi:hypothetical protein
MSNSFVIFVSLAVASTGLLAAPPIARVISNDSVDIDGITSPARNYVPVGLDGEVTTHSAPAVIQFSDGSTVVLQPNSHLKIDGRAGRPEVRIIRGAAELRMKPGSTARFNPGVAQVAARALDSAVAQANSAASPAAPIAEALMARQVVSTGATEVTPGSPIATGGFLSTPSFTGTFRSADGGGVLSSFVTPSGLTINVIPNFDAGGNVSYTIASITQTATNPQGQTVIVTVTAFNGDTIHITPPAAVGSASSTATISTPTGALVNTSTVTNTIINTALSQGATVPTPGVSTGQFSGTAN